MHHKWKELCKTGGVFYGVQKSDGSYNETPQTIEWCKKCGATRSGPHGDYGAHCYYEYMTCELGSCSPSPYNLEKYSMQEYVVGFAFEDTYNKVILIEKNRPDWQKGKYNGVGGHIEEGETPIEAMVREFKEETGLDTSGEFSWKKFAVLEGSKFRVHVFSASLLLSVFHSAQSITDEKISKCHIQALPEKMISNLKWLVPMGINAWEDAYFREAIIKYD